MKNPEGVGQSTAGCAEAVMAQAGVSVSEAARMTGKTRYTIAKWWRDEPMLFDIVMLGIKTQKKIEEEPAGFVETSYQSREPIGEEHF
jgi:predicted transcriptional regulator